MCAPLWVFQAAFISYCLGVYTLSPAILCWWLKLCWGQWRWNEPCRVTVSQPSAILLVQFSSSVLGHLCPLPGPAECVHSVIVQGWYQVQTVVSVSRHTPTTCNAFLTMCCSILDQLCGFSFLDQSVLKIEICGWKTKLVVTQGLEISQTFVIVAVYGYQKT